MKATLTIFAILAAIAGASSISYEIAYQRAVQKAQAAAFYDAYWAALHNGYFVARGRADAYYWSVSAIVDRYQDFLSASKELGVSEEERSKTEKLIARYYYARGEVIPTHTADLMSSVPPRESFPLPDIPTPERLRSAIDAGSFKK